MQWRENCFATLTYSEAPVSLRPVDLTLFLKRLRSRWYAPIRYFAVGEYSPSMRPHYHLALFNFPACQRPVRSIGPCPCVACSAVSASWGFGHIMLGSLEARSAQYIAGYVLKKLSSVEPKLSSDQIPEFARMSLRPGIGAGATWDVASVLMQYPSLLKRSVDVPTCLRHGVRQLPLGPYLRRLIRKRVGLDEKAPEDVIRQAKERVSVVFDYADAYAPKGFKREFVKATIGDVNDQLNRNVAAKSKVKRSYQ